VIAAVLQPDRGPRRYVVPGHFVTGEELYATASRVTGRRLLHVPVPARFLAMQMRLVDQMMARMPERVLFPGDTEGVELNHRATRFDDSPARTELSVTPHSLEETIRDTARWMIETGRLKPGRLRN
jgi:nucleoside-diphosphate-sugar epimerase